MRWSSQRCVRTLDNVGCARVHLGDPGGIADLEESIQLALQINSPELSRGYNNLSQLLAELGDVRRSLELRREAVRAAERFGNPRVARIAQGVLIMWEHTLGDWDEFLARAEAFLEESARLGGGYQDASLISRIAMIALARGDEAEAAAEARRALELGRGVGDPQILRRRMSSVLCSSCGEETPAGFPRCANCGAPLDEVEGALAAGARALELARRVGNPQALRPALVVNTRIARRLGPHRRGSSSCARIALAGR